MRIGIVCYASVGGSGVVATELARALAEREHHVHLISSEVPFRWRNGAPNLSFERVDSPAYPLFREPQYLLALTTTIARVVYDHKLDIVHAHYAVPHATAAYLADRMLSLERGACRPRTVTTLHGTDITLVGSDPLYSRVVAFSIEQSHGVTAVSESLRRDTIAALGITRDIRVIPNFLQCDRYRRQVDDEALARIRPHGGREPVIMHVSNFRPVKRVGHVLDVFHKVRERTPARLVMVGSGPDRAEIERRVIDEGLGSVVTLAGEQQDLPGWLSVADVFLLPSSQESFGLAALEAMACEVPVVASRVGGLPEVVEDGRTGFLCEPADLDGMAERIVTILKQPSLRATMGAEAAKTVRARFCANAIVPLYESDHREML